MAHGPLVSSFFCKVTCNKKRISQKCIAIVPMESLQAIFSAMFPGMGKKLY